MGATSLPHNPRNQDHGGFVEGVEELDQDLPFGPQFPQGDSEDDGEDHQAKDVHALHLFALGHLVGEERRPSAHPPDQLNLTDF